MAVKDDIRKFELEINAASKNGETFAQLQKLGKETAKLNTENTELQKTLGFLRAKGQQNTEEYKRMTKQLKLNKAAIKENGIAMNGLQKSLDVTQLSMNQLRKRSNSLKSMLGATSKAANPQEYDKLEKELKQVGTAMTNLKGKGNETKFSFGKLKDSAKGLLPAFGWGALITGAIGLTKKIFDLAQQTIEYRKQVARLTGESGAALTILTAKLSASAETFSVDFNKLTVATHNFAKAMDISEKQANDLINKGFIAGADASGEFLDKLKEYGPQFKAVGLSAEQSIAKITQEVTEGVYSDKGIDAIKEAGLSLREMPKTAADAVDAIGLSSKEMMEQIASGEITVFEAIQKVSKKMSELPPQSSEVGQALADIFKGAGEDAGLDYILMLGETEASLDDLIEKTGELGTITEQTLAANTNLAISWNLALGENNTLLTKAKNDAKNVLAEQLFFYSTALKFIFLGKKGLIKDFNDAVDDSSDEALDKEEKFNSNLNRLAIKAQKELNIALNKSVRANTARQTELENARWEKEKAALELRLINKANLNAQELALNDILHKLIEEKERFHQETLASIREKAAKDIKTPKQQKLAETIKADQELDTTDLDIDVEKGIQAEIDFEKAKAEAVKKYRQLSLEELRDEELMLLQTAYDQKLISEEIFQEAKLEIETRYADIQAEDDERRRQERIAKYQEYIGIISMAAQGFSSVVQNLQAAEFEDLESRRERGVIDEEAYEKESIAIKKKYADKEFIAAIANIAASTAQGVMQSFAQFGPILGAILSAIPIAAGATQAVVTNKQRQRVKQLRRGKYGYNVVGEDDGRSYNVPFTQSLRTGLQRTPTLVAEEPEIVVSTKDTARVMGHNPLLLNAIKAPQDYAVVPQRASGNLPDIGEGATGSASLERMVAQSTAIMEQLADKGIVATAFYGNDETRKIKDQQDEDASLLAETSFN